MTDLSMYPSLPMETTSKLSCLTRLISLRFRKYKMPIRASIKTMVNLRMFIGRKYFCFSHQMPIYSQGSEGAYNSFIFTQNYCVEDHWNYRHFRSGQGDHCRLFNQAS